MAVGGHPINLDSDDPVVANRLPTSAIERVVYFVQPPNGFKAPSGRYLYCSQTAATVAPLKPGRYAVVGSSGVHPAGNVAQYMSKVGRTINATTAIRWTRGPRGSSCSRAPIRTSNQVFVYLATGPTSTPRSRPIHR